MKHTQDHSSATEGDGTEVPIQTSVREVLVSNIERDSGYPH
jgi:hypothetical protein